MQSLMEQNTIDENFLNDTNYWAIRKNEIRKQVLQDYKKNPIALQNRSTKKYQQDKLDNQNSFETFSEGFSDSFKVENTPFLGSWIEGNKFKKLNEITAKIYNQGFNSLDYNEQVEFEKYRNELIKQNVYGDSFAYKLGGIALNNAKYVIEYATTQAIANTILPGAGILLTSAIQTANPIALRNEYWARQLAGDLNITEKGEMFFGNLEKDPVKTFLKSYAGLLATNLSEKFGDVLASSTPIKAISNKLTGGYKKMFDLLFVGNGTNSKGIKGGLQSLFNGLVGENVEEYLEQPLRELLGGGEEDYTLENIVKAFDITWDDFLLTNASIVMQGGISNTSLLLANKLKSNKNLSQQDIINYLETQPVEQKEKDLKRLQLAENEAEKREYKDWQKTQKEVLLKAGATEQEANDQLEIINKFISHGAVNFLDTPTSRINFLKQNNFELQNGINSLDSDNVFNQSLDIARQNEELDAKFPEYTEKTININGVEKSVFNSNGDRIAKSKEALENFYKWFGDSKVVNEKGEPLVVYHSTNAEFDTFSKRKLKGGVFARGFYFSKNKERTTPYGKKTLSTYLKMKNPFIINNGDGLSSAIANQLEITKKEIAEKYGYDRYYKNIPTDTAYRNFLQDKGYDGIVSEATQEIVVFEPNQIKSVENKGQFSLNNDNIYYQNQNNQPQGQYNTSNGIATLFNSSNFSTPIHEFAHYWRQLVNNFSRAGSEQAKKELDILNKYVGAKNNESWTRSQEEKFARSFEAYLTKGVAPTEELKPLFQRIKEAMANVYNSIKNLNVSLTPEITKYFDNIFSDVDIEGNTNYQQAYQDLQKEIEDEKKILYQQGLSEEEVNKAIDDKFGERLAKIEAEMQSLNYKEYNVDEYLKKLDEYKKSQGILSSVGNIYNNLTDFLNETIVSENQNIREISEKIYMKYLNMDFAINQDLKKYSDILEKFNKSVLDLKKNNSKDYEKFSIAWYNNNMEEIKDISTKYGFFEEFKNVRAILEELYDRQVEVGVDIGYRKNYLPTRIKANEFEKVKNVIAEKYGSDILSELEKVATEKGYLLNSPEGISLLSNYLRGYTPRGITLSPSNFTKQRTLERSSDFYPFYQTFEKSLADYISQTTRNINERAFFGKSTAEQQKELTKLKRKETQLTKTTDENKRKKLIDEISELRKNIENTNINLESSIGKVIAEELPNISVKDADKLKDFLLSLFKKEPTGKLTQATNTLSGIYVLPNPKSVLKQLTELSASIRDFGLNKTITSLFSKNLVNMKDLGLDVDINEPSKLQKLYSNALKLVGFDKADMIGKNTYLNSAFLDTQEKIKNNDKKTISNLEMMFEDKAEEVKEKFLQGKATDYDVMSYLFYLINDTQPLSSGSKTKYFNDHPSLRWMYNLKSYLIQQISFVKNNVINEAKKGNIATATKNLVNLQLSLWFTGVPISMIADILFGDDDDRTLWEKLPDFMIDNLILNNILNRFNLLKIIGGNIGDFVLGFTTPSFVKPLNYLGHDLFNIVDIINGEKESKLINKNSTIKQFKNLVEKLD